jgi:serine protease Do
MKRALLWLLGALLVTPSHAEVDRAAFVRLGGSVLKIEAIRVQGGYSLGSGVIVGAHQVVTNCHVTRDASEIHVLRNGARFAVDAQVSDVDHDLCVLHVPGIDGGAVQLGHADALKIGQPVTALGYSGGIGMQNSRGDVVALHRLDGSHVIQSTNWFNSGASGGGLFDDDLRLVGILTFRLRGGGAHYFAAPVEWIDALLADGRPRRAIGPFGVQEQAFWQRPIEAQPDFLKAAVLERDRDWPGLEALTTAWSRAAPADAEPWYLQGVALAQLDRLAAAREALERSVQIEAALAPAWFKLGVVYLRLGLKERARTALARLESINGELALQLARLIESS